MRRMKNFTFAMMFFLALTSIAGLAQEVIEDAKEEKDRFGVTLEWKPKSSMKYDTIGRDFSHEPPMLEEILNENLIDIYPKGILQ